MDVIAKILDLAKQAIAATDRWERLRLILQIVALATAAGIDLLTLFAPGGPLSGLAGGVRAVGLPPTSLAVEAVEALEVQAVQASGRAVPTAAPGTGCGAPVDLSEPVRRVVVELARLAA